MYIFAVAPLVGAWIEIVLEDPSAFRIAPSLPSWERRLQSSGESEVNLKKKSPDR